MRWNIIRKAENGLYYLEFVEFESGCSGATIFERIQQLCLPRKRIFSDRASSLLYSPIVYTTTVIKVSKAYFPFAHNLTFEGTRVDQEQRHRKSEPCSGSLCEN
jgi:hypothetical protein